CTAQWNNVAKTLACENNNVCDGIMACDHLTGNSCIQTVPPLVCNADAVPNTCVLEGVCDPKLGCNPPVEQADLNSDGIPDNPGPVACDDLNACTGPDTCADRVCHGAPWAAAAACVAGGTVCSPQACDPTSGACVATPLDCDDGNPCTRDTCDPTAQTEDGACVHVNNQAACDDGNACNGAE